MDIKKRKLLVPAKLEIGDTIGIAAPASPFNLKEFKGGVSVLESMGFETYCPEGIFNKNGYLAGDDENRAAVLNDLFSDSRIKAIICARGGFGSMRILSLLDYDMIFKNPKIFAGYSDVSALLSSLYEKCRLVTFHGPTVTTLSEASKRTRQAMYLTLTNRSDFEVKLRKGVSLKSGITSGTMLGGNLATLCHLIGTSCLPSYRGRILFIEERGEALYRIDRMLTQMKLAGCFDGLAGLLLGSFTDCGPAKEIYKVVTRVFGEMDIPVLAGFDGGHGKENITIPFGIKTTLDAGRKIISFKWQQTR
ncbi:MAG: LD-carboxypeptidase [Proteobacteria bacterium]|nr:LD-carboxypeptidase [Pseudomonadota bacterium]